MNLTKSAHENHIAASLLLLNLSLKLSPKVSVIDRRRFDSLTVLTTLLLYATVKLLIRQVESAKQGKNVDTFLLAQVRFGFWQVVCVSLYSQISGFM